MSIYPGSAVVSLVGVVLGLTLFEFDIASLFTLYLMTRVTFGLLGVYFVRQWLTWPFDFRILRAMLPFAAPFGLICMTASFANLDSGADTDNVTIDVE